MQLKSDLERQQGSGALYHLPEDKINHHMTGLVNDLFSSLIPLILGCLTRMLLVRLDAYTLVCVTHVKTYYVQQHWHAI